MDCIIDCDRSEKRLRMRLYDCSFSNWFCILLKFSPFVIFGWSIRWAIFLFSSSISFSRIVLLLKLEHVFSEDTLVKLCREVLRYKLAPLSIVMGETDFS